MGVGARLILVRATVKYGGSKLVRAELQKWLLEGSRTVKAEVPGMKPMEDF